MQGTCDDPGNTATGAYSASYGDLRIPGRGLALDFNRSYGSAQAASSGPLGYGWNFSYGLSLVVDGGTGEVTVNQEDGSQVRFAQSGSTYSAPAFIAASLAHNGDGTWTMTRKARTKFTFDATGRLTKEADLNGYATVLSYPSASSEVVTDAAGRTLTLTLSAGKITQVSDSSSPARSVGFAYDANGDLSDVTDVGGGVTRFGYDSAHRLLSTRQPKFAGDTTTSPAPVETVGYDPGGRMTSRTDQVGNTTTYDYASIAAATKVSDAKGNIRVDRYENGRLSSSTRGFGTSAAATSHYVYDASASELLAECDPRGSCAITIYDSAGNALTSADGLGRRTVNSYDALNDPLTSTDPKGVKTTSTYDAAGNILTRSKPLLNASGGTTATQKTTYNYGATTPVYPGDVTSITDANNKTTQYRYDAYGNLVSQTAPVTPENASGNKTSHSYNTGTGWRLTTVSPRGNLSGATASQYTTTYVYDPFGRQTQVKDPLWVSSAPLLHQHSNHYDANGNLDYEIDASNHKTSYAYDPANQLVKTTPDDGTYEQRAYNGDATLNAYTNARGKVTTYAYDPLAHTTAITDPLNRTTAFVYDPAGNLIRKILPGGTCTIYPYTGCEDLTYDHADELTTDTWADGLTTGTSNVTYDADGQRTGFTDASGASAWTWDSLNRLTSVKDGNNKTVSYGYDIADHQTTLTYPGGINKITRNFDAAGRIDSIQDYKSNKTSFGYDADSNLTTATEPTAAGVIDTYTYDRTGHTSAIKTAKGATTLANFVYTRDGSNYVATSTTTGITEPAQTNAYNALEQLTTSGPTSAPTSYSYDPDGNATKRGSSSLSYDDGDQLCWQSSSIQTNPSCPVVPSGANTFSYDSSGNRTTRVASAVITTYGYDEFNQLRSYNGTAAYVYDDTGLRASKTISGTKTSFTWDHDGAAPSLLSDGANNYIYGPDGELLEQITSAGTVTYAHHDQLGSTRLLTSTSGANVGTYTYDAYGTVSSHTGSVATPLQYVGEYTDSESGLVYLRARYYDPASAQFINIDPALENTRTAYSYADDNPVNNVDPTGECVGPLIVVCAEAVWAAGGVLVAAGGAVLVHHAVTHSGSLDLPHVGNPFKFAKKKSRGGPGPTPTGPKRPARYRRKEGPRSGGRGNYRKPPPGRKGPWPPKKKR